MRKRTEPLKTASRPIRVTPPHAEHSVTNADANAFSVL